MAYIGNPPAEAYTNTVKDSFNGDGSTVAFTMSQPSVTNDVRVVVENVIQDPTVAYSCSGTTLTFTSAPPSGTNNIYVVHLGPAVMTTVPPSDIASATTFASNVTVQGAFTSQGIDDNATSTAMTLDTSGNLLVGKTSDTYSTAGFRADGRGFTQNTRDGNITAYFNRLTSDGTIVQFDKDGSTVGSIGTANGYMELGSSDTGIWFYTPSDAVIPANPSTNSARDAAIDLGISSQRFKDLYLSGGVYLGGTGSANKLDEVEEGTYTAVITPTSGSVTLNSGQDLLAYTKIGRQVTITGRLHVSSISSPSGSGFNINLPFAVSNIGENSSRAAFIAEFYDFNFPTGAFSVFAETGANATISTFIYSIDDAGWSALPPSGFKSSTFFYFNGTYFAA